MARINDPLRENISTIADEDLLAIVDVTDDGSDKNITMAQIKEFSAPDITGKQDLITAPTNNDIVLTDINGQTKGSGVQLSQLIQLNSSGQLPDGINDVAFSLNSGNVDSDGNADLLIGVGETTLSFKVGDGTTYPPLKLTYADKSQETLTSIPNITEGFIDEKQHVVIKEFGQNPTITSPWTISQGKNFPTSPTDGHYHCLTATGLQTFKYIVDSWVETQYVVIGVVSVMLPSPLYVVSNSQYNRNGYNTAEAGLISKKYINLTLGSSVFSYIAPTDGYIFLNKYSSAIGQIITLDSTSFEGGLFTSQTSSVASQKMGVYLPLRAGESCRIYYTAGGATDIFRFIYTEGAKL